MFLFRVGKTAAGNSQKETVDKPEVIADIGLAGAWRKQSPCVGDLTAHLVPDLGQPIRPVFGLDIDLDDGQAGPGDGIELVELRQFLYRLF